MFFIDISDPWILLISIFLVICLIYLGKEAKNAYVPLMSLIVFLILLVMHGIQFLILPAGYDYLASSLAKCMLLDFLLIFITYMAYLWIDDVEAKAKKKKSIDNSLDWFWKNV